MSNREYKYTYKLIKSDGSSSIRQTEWTTSAWHELERKNKTRVLVLKSESREVK